VKIRPSCPALQDRSGGRQTPELIRQFSKAWASSELRSAQESRFKRSRRLQGPETGLVIGGLMTSIPKDPYPGSGAPASKRYGAFSFP